MAVEDHHRAVEGAVRTVAAAIARIDVDARGYGPAIGPQHPDTHPAGGRGRASCRDRQFAPRARTPAADGGRVQRGHTAAERDEREA